MYNKSLFYVFEEEISYISNLLAIIFVFLYGMTLLWFLKGSWRVCYFTCISFIFTVHLSCLFLLHYASLQFLWMFLLNSIHSAPIIGVFCWLSFISPVIHLISPWLFVPFRSSEWLLFFLTVVANDSLMSYLFHIFMILLRATENVCLQITRR